MNKIEIHSCPEMMDYIQEVGLLPLLNSGIPGYSAEDIVSEECRYVVFPDGGWDWPLWKWKGQIVAEGNCVYGKFFAGKAARSQKKAPLRMPSFRPCTRMAA